MNIIGLVDNRKELVKAIEELTGSKLEYHGAPSFVYEGEGIQVLRDGSLEVDSKEEKIELLKELAERKLIDNSWDEDRDVLILSLPMAGHTGQSLVNLVSLFYSKGELINRAVKAPKAFVISQDFMDELIQEAPKSCEDFLNLWESHEGEEVTKGIAFNEEKISILGFPSTEDGDWIQAYGQLLTKMNELAKRSKYVQLKQEVPENEKYFFRVWLVRLGFDGPEYKTTRKVLLSNLKGHSAFKTEDQQRIHKERYGKKKEVAECLE